MARVVKVHEAKAHLSQLLRRVQAGEVVILSRYGKPCAKLVPVEEDEGRDTVPLGFVEFTTPESFFEPLPEEELAAWESRDR